MITIPNDMIACEPLKSLAIETQGNTFKTVKQKNSLLALKVVYPSSLSHPYSPGDTVYIRGDTTTLTWTKEKFTLGDQEVILVPCAFIQAWERP